MTQKLLLKWFDQHGFGRHNPTIPGERPQNVLRNLPLKIVSVQARHHQPVSPQRDHRPELGEGERVIDAVGASDGAPSAYTSRHRMERPPSA